MFTGFITAGAALLLLPVSLLVDRPRGRAAGLFGVSLVVALFLLAQALLWLTPILAAPAEEGLAMTLGSIAFLGPCAFILLLLLPTKAGALPARAGLPITAVALIIFLVAAWLPSGWREEPWWQTGWTIAGTGLIAICALAGGLSRWWRWLGVAGSAVALLLLLFATWFERRTVLVTEETLFVVTSAPSLLAYANLLLLVPLRGERTTEGRDFPSWQTWVRAATLLAAAVGTAATDTVVVSHLTDESGVLVRLAAATGIFTACGTLAILVLGIVNRRIGIASPESAPALPTHLALPCPLCRRKLDLPVGAPLICAGCGLRITVQLEVAACRACGYALFGATTSRCPECGAATGLPGVAPPPHGARPA
jgi:hypothetical protein